MNIRNTLVIFILSYNSVSLSAHANSLKNDRYYIQLNGGFARGLSPLSLNFINNNMKTSAIYGAEFGYKINNYFAASLSLDHRPNFFNKATSTVYASGLPILQKVNIKVKSMVTMLNIHASSEINGIKPYLTAGIGMAVNRTHNASASYLSTSGNQLLLLNMKIAGQGRDNLAFKVGGGVKIPISNSIDLDIRYQFVNLGKFKTGNSCQSKLIVNPNTTTSTVPSLSAKLRTHEVIFGLSYKF